MERLTKRGIKQEGMIWFVDHENNDMPLEPCEMYSSHNRVALEKLADYEDKQEHGLLIELPVPIGEEVYCIFGREISKNRVISYQTPPPNVDGVIAKGYMGTLLGVVGENVFATRSEAEEALARMKGE